VVQVAVVITNISQQAIDVFFTIDTFTNKFVVIGPDGKPAPPTKAPGQTGAFGGASLLSDLVDFSKPGTYRITATRHFAPPIDETDTSDVLEIKVP
jgi:hypothetical protein